jgi:PAS domain S-box-containing protein
MTDAEGCITFYNEAAAALWGCRPELGDSKFCGSWKLYWSDGTPLPHDECPMAMALRQQRPIRGVEAVAERPDGTRIAFVPYPTPLFDASGKLTGAVNMLVDIGEHKRAETRLAERNAQLDLAGKIARIGSFIYDDATQKLQLSAGCAAIYGLPEGTLEMSRKDWRALVHPDDLRRLDAVTRRALANCEAELVLEFRILRRGEVRWIESRVLISYNKLGRALRRFGAEVDVTERKQVELALAERNTQIELATKALRVGSLTIDLHSGLVKLSPGCAAIFGLPESALEMSRADGNKLIHPDDLASVELHRDQALLKQQREFIAQFRIRRADDGEVRWIEARSVIFYDQGGKPAQMVGIRIDFTDRKLAADMLAERNLQLELAGKAGLVGSYAYDVGADVIQVSEGYVAAHGLAEGTKRTTRSEWRARAHPEDVARVEEIRERAFVERRGEYGIEYRIVRSGGEVRWIEARSFISYDTDGRPQRVVGVNIDITERKQTELALAERNKLLALAGRAALVSSHAYDADLERMTVSDSYAAIHGLPEGTKETTRTAWRARVHPDDLGRLEENRARTFRDKRDVYNVDYRIVHASGEVRWVEARGIVSYDSDGHPQRVIGINIDVTERKRAEQHQRALNAELDHRVKNVLATVSAIIAQTQEASSSQADFMTALNSRINSLARTHELLSESNWRGASLAEIVRRELAPYMSGNTEVRGPSVTLKAEATQAVATVLHELATNAAKYGALSNPSGLVSVQWRWLQNGSHDRLLIEWQETGAPPVLAPNQSGYGTSIIRELIPFELGGEVELSFAPNGTRCRLEISGEWASKEKWKAEESKVSESA